LERNTPLGLLLSEPCLIIKRGLYKGANMSGGGSGGGGNSGKVDYPAYIKHVHGDWLASMDDPIGDPGTHDDIETSVTEVMNAALGGSPFVGLSAYDPTAALDAMDAAIAAINTGSIAPLFNSFSNKIITTTEGHFTPVADFNEAVVDIAAQLDTTLFDTTEINADINAFGTLLDTQINATVLPTFRRGMQDINAVQSSAYVLGAALIASNRNNEVVKYGTALNLQHAQDKNKLVVGAALDLMKLKEQGLVSDGDLAYRTAQASHEYNKALAALITEAARIRIVANKEWVEADADYDEKDAKWDLEVFQYGANVLAASSGGTSQAAGAKSNKTASALGGALSGAAAGAMMTPATPWIGGAIGGAVGLIGGLL
jgi:hypothetical protein